MTRRVGSRASGAWAIGGDVGATHTRVRLHRLDRDRIGACVAERVCPTERSRDHLPDVVRALLAGAGAARARAGVFGVPGKVSGDRRQAAPSYLDAGLFWDMATPLERAGIDRVLVYNDLECGMRGSLGLPESLLIPLSGPRPVPGWTERPALLAMPGSGLGFGVSLGAGRVVPSEGGNVLAAFRHDDPLEVAAEKEGCRSLGDSLGTQACQPSYDTLVSGPGLALLFRAAARIAPPTAAAQLVLDGLPLAMQSPVILAWADGRAAAGVDPPVPAAAAATRLFTRLLARAIQQVALVVMAEVLLVGGSLCRAIRRPLLEEMGTELARHPRHDRWLGARPLLLVEAEDVNLRGAASLAGDLIAAASS